MSIKVYNKMKGKIQCPKCKSNNTKKRGIRKTGRGKIQRYFCKDCKYSFVQDNEFYRMRNTPQKVTLCMDLFFNGMSSRAIQSHLSAFYPHNADHRTILRWIVKYSNIIYDKVKDLKLKVGNEIQTDEMEYKTKGKRTWFIDSIDTKTRFMVSSEFVKERGQKEIKRVLLRAKNKTGNQVAICTTDGLSAYENIVRKTWGYDNKLGKYKIKHKVVTQSRGEGFNHKIERLHNSVRARTKTFRGFKNLNCAKAIMRGYEVYYNFLRNNLAINCCPYELATDLKLNSANKWIELIQISKKQ